MEGLWKFQRRLKIFYLVVPGCIKYGHNFFQERKRKPDIFSTDVVPEQTEDAYDPIEEQVKAMYAAIGNLSKIDKAIVMLYLEDYSYQEIGDMMGITPNNVGVKMNRIKIRLKEETQKTTTI